MPFSQVESRAYAFLTRARGNEMEVHGTLYHFRKEYPELMPFQRGLRARNLTKQYLAKPRRSTAWKRARKQLAIIGHLAE